jgi:DNA-binding MarR family transcriptional regulator
MMAKMKANSVKSQPVSDRQARAFDEGVATLLQRFKLEPSIIAGSPYADLHANDVGLLVVLVQPEEWSVRRIAQALGAPISTISSALDRLERRALLTRNHGAEDRRVVRIELTAAGHRLVEKIRASQIEACRAMLARLSVRDREDVIRLVTLIANG